MADHAAHHEYAIATGNDYAEHERTYDGFIKFARIATATLVLIMIALGIGGVDGRWNLAGFGIILALVAGAIGAATPKGSVVPVLIAAGVILVLWLLFG